MLVLYFTVPLSQLMLLAYGLLQYFMRLNCSTVVTATDTLYNFGAEVSNPASWRPTLFTGVGRQFLAVPLYVDCVGLELFSKMGAGWLYCSPLLNKMAIRLYEKIIARVEMKRKQTLRVGEYEYLNWKTKEKKKWIMTITMAIMMIKERRKER